MRCATHLEHGREIDRLGYVDEQGLEVIEAHWLLVLV
jgi:hypothetical protein